MLNASQHEQNQKMKQALTEYYATRDKPKPPAPVHNEVAELYKGLQDYAASENAKRMEELNECFRLRNIQNLKRSNRK